MIQARAASDGYRLSENASLKRCNTLRVNARARLLAELHDAAALPHLLDQPGLRHGRVLILGQGSNVLFSNDFDGAVVLMATRGIRVEEQGQTTRITVAAGEAWDGFVRWSLSQGYAGLENLILIPGSVGAAPIQNIGAYGVEVAEWIESVAAWDRQQQRAITLDKATCAFGYRDSLFKRDPERYLVTAVRFALPRQHSLRLSYAGIDQELASMGISKPTPLHVAAAVTRLRRRKLPDPALIGNAGSFFKNPQIDADAAAALRAEHPDMPQWPVAGGRCKLSAAWLIEAVGYKGWRQGDAGISKRHALVLVNHGQADGAQLWALAQRLQTAVQQRFGVRLEPELRII